MLGRVLALLPDDERRVRRTLPWVVFLAVLVKILLALLIYIYNPQGVLESSDSFEYHQLAINLRDHGVYSRAQYAPFDFEVIRTPAYPLFLSGLYKVFGTEPVVIPLAQTVLSVMTLLATAGIGSLLFGRRAGFLAALFISVDPVSLYYVQVMLTETMFTTLLTVCLFCLLRAIKEPDVLSWPLAAGAVLSLATYTRPTSYYLGALFPLILVLALRGPRGWRKGMKAAFLMFSIYALSVGSWQAYNFLRTASLEFSQAKNQYLFIAKAAAIVAARDGVSLEEAQRRLTEAHSAAASPSLHGASPTQVYESQGKYAWSVIAAHPLLFVRTSMKGAVINLFSPSNLSHLFGMDNVELRRSLLKREFSRFTPMQWMMAFSSWAYGAVFLAIVYFGVALLAKQGAGRSMGVVLLSLTIFYVIALSSGPEAYSRFRSPIMPALCILAGGGFSLNRTRSALGRIQQAKMLEQEPACRETESEEELIRSANYE